MPKRALLIVNRKSRGGAMDIESAIGRLKASGIEVIEAEPGHPQQIGDLIRKHSGQADCVIIGGGDGSMNAAAAALVETGLPLGVLPMGTANDLARTLHIPTDLEQAADVIAMGVLHRIDLGQVNGRYFFNVANIGLGVRVTHNLSPDLKQRWGVFSYVRSLIKAFRSFRPFHVEIVCDGRRRQLRSIQIAIGNGRHYGGGMTIEERASIDDHRLSLYAVEPARWWDLLKAAPAFRAGRFKQHHPVLVGQACEIEVITRKPMAVTADGEVVTCTPAEFRVLPHALGVFVPAAYFDEQEEMHAAQRQPTNGA